MTSDESNYGVTWLDLSPANVTIISQARKVGISVPHIYVVNPVSFGGTTVTNTCTNVKVSYNLPVFSVMEKSL